MEKTPGNRGLFTYWDVVKGDLTLNLTDKQSKILLNGVLGCDMICARNNRVAGWLTSILHRMGVVLMKNKFNFNDLMQFGLFILCKLRLIGTPVPLLRNGYSIFIGTKYR